MFRLCDYLPTTIIYLLDIAGLSNFSIKEHYRGLSSHDQAYVIYRKLSFRCRGCYLEMATRRERESKELDRVTATGVFLLYDRPATRIKKVAILGVAPALID